MSERRPPGRGRPASPQGSPPPGGSAGGPGGGDPHNGGAAGNPGGGDPHNGGGKIGRKSTRGRKGRGLLRRPTFWISVLSLSAVFFVVVGDLGRTAPGPLAAAHANVVALSGFRSCTQCHGGWFSDMSSACLECHEIITKQIEAGRGLHGILGEAQAKDCARCHSEHHGAEFAMVNEQSFRQAGFASRAGFDHQKIGFDMWGRHLELDCAKCHQHAAAKLVPEGAHRFLGLSQDCSKCHQDPHEGQMQLGCASCHGQQSFDELVAKEHDRFLPLTGIHGELGCRDCHEKSGTHSLEAVGGSRPAAPRQCAMCHASPHSERFALAVAEVVGKGVAASCSACHDSTDETFRKQDFEITAEQHACSGFPLQLPHDRQKCAECHDPGLSVFSARYPGRGPDGCHACHTDPHGGQFVSGPFASGGCLSCHERERFDPHAFSVEKHRLTRLPLTGTHLEQKCEDCHKRPADDQPRLFRGTPAHCGECHQDAHAGFFDRLAAVPGGDPAARPAGETRGKPADRPADQPADQPAVNRWGKAIDPPARKPADQPADQPAVNRWGKPIDPPSRKPADRPADQPAVNRWGKPIDPPTRNDRPTVNRWGKPVARGVVGSAGPPPAKPSAEKISCSVCHQPTKFTEVDRFDHQRWTGFPITGAHAQEQCVACHRRSDKPDETGRTFGRIRERYGAMQGCVTCHKDPHRGQFDLPELPGQVRGRRDCARCHSDNSFRSLADDFDHGAWTGFALKGRHAKATCNACHAPLPRPDRHGRSLGRAKGRECVDCHTSPHGSQFLGRTCSACHKAADTFKTLVFDHDIHSRFKLGERHRAVACARCHQKERDGAETFVRYRPLRSQCVDCHATHDNPLRRRKGGRR
jgi:hypothetical protein